MESLFRTALAASGIGAKLVGTVRVLPDDSFFMVNYPHTRQTAFARSAGEKCTSTAAMATSLLGILCNFSDEDIFKVANSRLGWYRRCGMNVVNFALSPKIHGLKAKDRPGLVDPLAYYLAGRA